MTAKQFLQQGNRLSELIQSHKDELQRVQEIDGTQTEELERTISDAIAEMVQVQLDIHAAIDAVQDRTERLVLRYRYIQGLTWTEITAQLNYSRQQVNRIHGQALQHVRVPPRYRKGRGGAKDVTQ